MPSKTKPYQHLATLISNTRKQKGFINLTDLYRSLNPPVDYQTWMSAEAGRRIPYPDSILEIGKILDIPKSKIIAAYCKDKFKDDECHKIVDQLDYKEFINVDTLIEAKEHERKDEYIFSTEQVMAMKNDSRLRLYLLYTYDENYKTNFANLSKFFGVPLSEVEYVIGKLSELKLVEVIGNEIKRIYKHTAMPRNHDVFNLRKEVLLKSLEISTNEDSHLINYHVLISEESFELAMKYLHFAEANLVRLEIADQKKEGKKSRFQIAMVANKIAKGKEEDELKQKKAMHNKS